MPKTIDRIKKQLLNRMYALTGQLTEAAGELPASQDSDPLDAAFQDSSNAVSSLLLEHERDELTRIKHALARISSGKYGVCETCKKSIPAARLQALPYVTTCVGCQQLRERVPNDHD